MSITTSDVKLPQPQPGKQTLFYECDADIVIYGGAAGAGKANRVTRQNPEYNSRMTLQELRLLEGQVLTPKGFKAIGDIQVGEQVCNPDGTIARVVAVHDRGLKEFYRVTFVDGASVEVCGEHLWGYAVASRRKRRKEEKGQIPSGLSCYDEWNYRYFRKYRVCDTLELKRLTNEAIAAKERGDRPHWVMIPLTAPCRFTFPKGKWDLLPPYTFGVLLGDGNLTGEGVTWCKPEPEIADYVSQELNQANLGLVVSPHADGHSYGIVGGCQLYLRRVGLMGLCSHEKFIPKQYLMAPSEDRWQLARGLMDTDGSCDEGGSLEFSSSSEQLAKDVQWLVRSLGFSATLSVKEEPVYTHNGEKRIGRPSYRLYIKGANTEKLFNLNRKRDRVQPYNGGAGDEFPGRRVVLVESIGEDYARCITVDNPNSLYLTDDFIVTHNSAGLLTKFTKHLKTRGFGAVIFRKTSPEIRNEGGLWDESLNFYQSIPGAIPRESLLDWHFPWGSTISFAHADKLRQKYPGSQMAWIGIDELQFWDEGDFWFLLSRNRTTCGVKPRLDATCNPDADCFVAKLIEWWWNPETGYPIEERSGVIRYFYRINEETYWGSTAAELEQMFPEMAVIAPPKSLTFIPGTIDDNPALLRVNPQYKANLMAQHPVDYERLYKGNWLIRFSAGTIFNRTWFEVVDQVPVHGQTCRFWDLAATAKDTATEKSFYSCGFKMRRVGNVYYILDIYWEQVGGDEGDTSIIRLAAQDGRQCIVAWELEGGSAALRYEATLRQKLSGYIVRTERPRGDKVTRAKPWATAARNGQIKVLRSAWNEQFFSSIERFNGQRIPLISDIIDGGSGAFDLLLNSARAAVPTSGELKRF